MKENLDLSLSIAQKLKKVFEFGYNKQKELVVKERISDELLDVLFFNIETFQSLVIIIDDLIDTLTERKEIFGSEGLEIEEDE
jgi:hypothetical protein